MILKTGCNYDVHNKQYNPGLLLGDLGFHVSFLEVWLSNLWLNFEIIQANIRQLNERCSRTNIARNSGHFAPVINCQRNLISKMADKNDRSQGKRIPCDFLNNLSFVDLFYEKKSWNETSCKKMLGLYSAERLIATKQYAAVPFVTFS